MKLLSISKQQYIYSLLHAVRLLEIEISGVMEDVEDLQQYNDELVQFKVALQKMLLTFAVDRREKSVCH